MKAFRTDAEQAAHDHIEAETAAGRDPFGDDEEIVSPSIEDQANDAAAKLAESNGEPVTDDADDSDDSDLTGTSASEKSPGAEAAAETAQPEPVAERPVDTPAYQVAGDDFAAQRKALRDEQRDIEAKWSSGDLTDDERADKLGELQDQRDALLRAETRAETLREVNDQNARHAAQAAERAEIAAMQAVAAQAKASGLVDYGADPSAAAEFDALFQAAKSSPRNAGKPAAELVEQAHKGVCALRGLLTTKPAESGRPEPRKAPDAPLTLRGLPAATTPNNGGTIADSVGRLTGQAFEAAYAKLTPAQKAALVDD